MKLFHEESEVLLQSRGIALFGLRSIEWRGGGMLFLMQEGVS